MTLRPSPILAAVPTLPTPPSLAGQVCFQIYRGAITSPSLLPRYLDDIRWRRLTSVCFHGFPRELVGAWDGLAKLAQNRGLLSLAAWGLDGERDNDGSPLTGTEKGDLMGQVLAHPSCLAGLADAEGRWDSSTGPGDVTSEEHALAMGEALRARAPGALVGDQCWFAIKSHVSRRAAPVTDPSNIFAGFPVDEFAKKVVNWARFRQAYCNEAGFKSQYGKQRYATIFQWMERDWTEVQSQLALVGLDRPLGVTIQAYGWDDIPYALVSCLLEWASLRRSTVFAWSDPYPSPMFLVCLSAWQFLDSHGFVARGTTARDIVRAYQHEYNATAPENKKIDEDGSCGLATMATMGLAPATSF